MSVLKQRAPRVAASLATDSDTGRAPPLRPSFGNPAHGVHPKNRMRRRTARSRVEIRLQNAKRTILRPSSGRL